MFDFVGKKYWFFLGSAIVILIGVISLAIPGGLKQGIEFQGGMSITLTPAEGIDRNTLNQKLAELGHGDALVQELRKDGSLTGFFIRTRLDEKLEAELGKLGDIDVKSVSPIVASETARNAAIALAVSAVAVLLYITWAFRKMPSPFRYGSCALIALIHDVLIALGLFSLFGRAFHWEVNPMFILGVLTLIGYSINDTVVVFDRIRENKAKGISHDFATIVNASLTQNLGRSLNTSLTTLLVVLGLYLFVGGTIRNFIFVMLVGVIAGTYSSIFIASQLVVVWERGEWGRFIPFLRRR